MNTYRPGDARRVPAHCFVESLCCKHTTSLTRLTSIKLKTITPKFKHSFFNTISKLCTPTLALPTSTTRTSTICFRLRAPGSIEWPGPRRGEPVIKSLHPSKNHTPQSW